MIESPDILERLRDLVDEGGKLLGFIDRSVVSRSRAVELLEMLTESLPVEMEQARDLIERREEVLEDARRQAGDIVDEAVRQAERLVDADQITGLARQRASEVGSEADVYVKSKLVSLEMELESLLDEVRKGINSVSGQ